MTRKISSLLLSLALLCAMLPAARAAAAVPLSLLPACEAGGKSVSVDVIAAEDITLTNYSLLLDWDKTALTLRDVTNGQSALMTQFLSNTNAGDPAYGRASAISSSNVTIPKGSVVATYLLASELALPAGEYPFTLTVRNAADETGSALAWKGGSVSGALTIPLQTAEAPLALAAAYDATAKTVTATLTATEAITLGSYDFRLDWDKTAFELTGVANGLSTLFPTFLSNTDKTSPGCGKVSAMSSGNNVTIPGGSAIATFTLSDVGAAAGEYTLTLTANKAAGVDKVPLAWKGASVSCAIAVGGTPSTVAVTGVNLNKTALTLTEGGSAALTATVLPSDATNRAVTWSSSDTSVVAVADGTVTALKAGTATVTATTQDGGFTAQCAVKVEAPKPSTIAVTGVTLDSTALTLVEGGTAALTATVLPADATNRTVTWKSSDESVASVSMGTITAKSPGTAVITAITEDGGKTAICTVTVEAKPAVLTGIRLSGKTSFALIEGMALDLSGLVVTAVYDGGKETVVTDYTVSGFDPATLGTQTLTIAYGTKTAELTVTVTARSVQEISIVSLPSKLSYQQGEAFDPTGLRLRVVYNNGTEGTLTGGWDSITGYNSNSPGTQALIVSYQGKTAGFSVTVVAKQQAGTTAKPALRLESVRGGKLVTLTAADGASIYYTTDGTAPTTSSAQYVAPVLISKKGTTTLKAIAVQGEAVSSVTTASISVFQVGGIDPNPGAGTVEAGTIVTLRTDTVGATIWYTDDGTDPNAEDANLKRYNGAIIIDKTITIKAIAVKDGYRDSAVTNAFGGGLTYTVREVPKPKDSVTVTLGSVRVAAGDLASVPVYLFTDSEDSTISSFKLSFTFDKNSFDSNVSVTPAETLDAATLYTSATGGTVNLLYQGEPIPGGEICTLNFCTLASMAEGTELSIEVNLGGSSIQTNATGGTSLTAMNATITLEKARITQVSGTVTYTMSNGDEASVSDLNSGEEPVKQIEASMSVDEQTTSNLRETTANVYLVIYDRDGCMVDAETWKVDLSDPAFMFIKTINIPTGIDVGAIKIMVLSEQMTPLMAASELAK